MRLISNPRRGKNTIHGARKKKPEEVDSLSSINFSVIRYSIFNEGSNIEY
jgi:hypothetical protein